MRDEDWLLGLDEEKLSVDVAAVADEEQSAGSLAASKDPGVAVCPQQPLPAAAVAVA